MKRRRFRPYTKKQREAAYAKTIEAAVPALQGTDSWDQPDATAQLTRAGMVGSGLSHPNARPVHSGNGHGPNKENGVTHGLSEMERSAIFAESNPAAREKLFGEFERRNGNGGVAAGTHNGVPCEPSIPLGTRKVIRGTPPAVQRTNSNGTPPNGTTASKASSPATVPARPNGNRRGRKEFRNNPNTGRRGIGRGSTARRR